MSEPYEVALRRRIVEARALPAIPDYVNVAPLVTIDEADLLADLIVAARRVAADDALDSGDDLVRRLLVLREWFAWLDEEAARG